MGRLTDKQKRFVKEYLADMNGTQAAIRAGYSKRSADTQASRLLGNDKVQRALAEEKARLSERLDVTQDWILEQLMENVKLGQGKKAVKLSVKLRDPDGAEHVEDLDHLCLDIKASNQALAQIAKMTGHDGASKVDVTTNGKAIESGVANVLVVPSVMDEAEWERLAMGGTDGNDAG